MKKLITLITLCSSLTSFAESITCTHSEVILTADVISKRVLQNVLIDELGSGTAYGSNDKELVGKVKGNYIRFKPTGSVNAEYKIAFPSKFVLRKNFPIFLDAWFEGGSGWYPRTLDCKFE